MRRGRPGLAAMVVQKTINNLKERPKDEKTAVATGGAILVVIVLLFLWGLWFVHNIRKGGEFNTVIGTKQDVFMTPSIRDAEKVLQDTIRPNSETLREYRDGTIDAPTPQENFGGNTDVFNTPQSPEQSD